MAALCSCSCGHDSCLSNPCQHNGGCINTGDDAYACSCDLAHWAGANCEQDVDECLSDNGGCGAALCHDTPGASRCGLDTCASGPCQVSLFLPLSFITALCGALLDFFQTPVQLLLIVALIYSCTHFIKMYVCDLHSDKHARSTVQNAPTPATTSTGAPALSAGRVATARTMWMTARHSVEMQKDRCTVVRPLTQPWARILC